MDKQVLVIIATLIGFVTASNAGGLAGMLGGAAVLVLGIALDNSIGQENERKRQDERRF